MTKAPDVHTNKRDPGHIGTVFPDCAFEQILRDSIRFVFAPEQINMSFL